MRWRTRKVYRVNGADGEIRLIGCAGDSADCQLYVRWAMGFVKDRPSFTSLEVLCVDERGRAWWTDQRLNWLRITHPFIAIGNGGDFAIGAMAAGKSARQAVRIANRLSSSCGFGVDVVRL
jgi:hypothetical protein